MEAPSVEDVLLVTFMYSIFSSRAIVTAGNLGLRRCLSWYRCVV